MTVLKRPLVRVLSLAGTKVVLKLSPSGQLEIRRLRTRLPSRTIRIDLAQAYGTVSYGQLFVLRN